MGYKESDWMLFKNKIVEWQEAYIDKLNKEYIELLSSDANPSEKFWALEKRIKTDKGHLGVTIVLKRSTMIESIIILLNDGVIAVGDLEDFSEELKESIVQLR